MAKTEVALFKGKTNLAARADRAGQGSENVTARDMAIPRLKLLQAISPEVQADEPEHVEGAIPGMLMNSVTNELYSSVYVLNLHFTRKTVVWKKRALGGGMFGTFENEAEAEAALAEAGEDSKGYDVSENPTHLVLILDSEGQPSDVALLDMPATKLKISKQWNKNIEAQQSQAEGAPRYSSVWDIGATKVKSSQGGYFNYKIDFVVDAPDSLYQAATEAFDSFFGLEKAA